MPTSRKILQATFADDTAILTSEKDPIAAVNTLQPHLNKINCWAKKWKIKINEDKSVQVNFFLNHNKCTQLQINNIPIPIQPSTKYLGIILDKRLTWVQHTKFKRKQANTYLHLLRPLLKSKMLLKFKTLI
jgi:hypothetical protein